MLDPPIILIQINKYIKCMRNPIGILQVHHWDKN